MRVGTIVRLLFAVAFSVFGLLCLGFAWQHGRRNRRYREAVLLKMPVDLSKRDAQYRGTLHSIWGYAPHGIELGIITPNGFSSEQDALRVVQGAKFAVSWQKPKGEPVFEYPLEEVLFHAYATNGRFYPVSIEDRSVKRKGDYVLTLKVVEPALALKGVRQTMVARYAWCGVEDIPIYLSRVLSFVFGLVSALLGVPVLLRYRRAEGGRQ